MSRVLLLRVLLASALVLSVVDVFQIAYASNPDFTLSVSPTSATVQAGSSARFTVSCTSKGGFQGILNLAFTISPNVINGPTGQLSSYHLYCAPGFSATPVLTVSTVAATPKTTYTITITGTDNSYPFTSHSVTATLTVT